MQKKSKKKNLLAHNDYVEIFINASKYFKGILGPKNSILKRNNVQKTLNAKLDGGNRKSE